MENSTRVIVQGGRDSNGSDGSHTFSIRPSNAGLLEARYFAILILRLTAQS